MGEIRESQAVWLTRKEYAHDQVHELKLEKCDKIREVSKITILGPIENIGGINQSQGNHEEGDAWF